MMRALLVLITLFISVVFLATSRGDKLTPFPFSDMAIHAETYVYYLCEHALLICLLHIIHVEAKSYQKFYQYIFWWQVFDTFDYLMTYNDIWFTVNAIPVSSNTAGFLFGALILSYESWKKN